MTIEEIKNLEHVSVTESATEVQISVEDGYKITEWLPSIDILLFYSFSNSYSPVCEYYPEYRVITDEENYELEQLKERAIAERGEQNGSN